MHYLLKMIHHEKNPEVNRSNTFCCIAHARILFRTDGQTMSNAKVADWLLAAESNNIVSHFSLILG